MLRAALVLFFLVATVNARGKATQPSIEATVYSELVAHLRGHNATHFTRDVVHDYDLGFLHNNDQISAFLNHYAELYPEITRLTELGRNANNQPIYEFLISSTLHSENREEDTSVPPRSAVRFTASIHGNELIGSELMLYLIDYLTTEYSIADSWARKFVDSVDIFILPLCNPYGREHNQRKNGKNVDLNRDFPDAQFDPENTLKGRQLETQILMKHTEDHHFVLSGEFHSGAQVVNYPYDCYPTKAPKYNKSPDDELFIHIANLYADKNPMFHNSEFPKGITNGAEWYCITGSLQDYQYRYFGIISELFEITDTMMITSMFDYYWDCNKNSIIAYLNTVLELGFTGTVLNEENKPIHAIIHIDEIPSSEVYTNKENGYYHRMVLAGSYTVWAEAIKESNSLKYAKSDKVSVVINNDGKLLEGINFVLMLSDSSSDSSSESSSESEHFYIGKNVNTTVLTAVILVSVGICVVAVGISCFFSYRRRKNQNLAQNQQTGFEISINNTEVECSELSDDKAEKENVDDNNKTKENKNEAVLG